MVVVEKWVGKGRNGGEEEGGKGASVRYGDSLISTGEADAVNRRCGWFLNICMICFCVFSGFLARRGYSASPAGGLYNREAFAFSGATGRAAAD